MILRSKKNILIYTAAFIILLIPAIALACFSIYELLICVMLTYPLGFASLIFLELSSEGLLTSNLKKSILCTFARIATMLMSIVLPAITIYFTNGKLIYLLASAFIMTTLYFSTILLKDNDGAGKFDLFKTPNNKNVIDVSVSHEADKNAEVVDVEVIDSNPNSEDR